jgi:hypothetical protein
MQPTHYTALFDLASCIAGTLDLHSEVSLFECYQGNQIFGEGLFVTFLSSSSKSRDNTPINLRHFPSKSFPNLYLAVLYVPFWRWRCQDYMSSAH